MFATHLMYDVTISFYQVNNVWAFSCMSYCGEMFTLRSLSQGHYVQLV